MATRHEVLGGKVQVYRRPSSPHWQCSASVAGRQHRISTKQEGLSQAKDFAEDWYLGLKGKDRFGGGLPTGKSKTFRQAAAIFLKEYKALNADQRNPKYISNMEGKVKNYLNPFFGDKPVISISESDGVAYRIHRSQALDEDGKPKKPARSTLHSEMITLGHIMQTAKRIGWIPAVPSFRAPYQASLKISHRAWFSLEEYPRPAREVTGSASPRNRARSRAGKQWGIQPWGWGVPGQARPDGPALSSRTVRTSQHRPGRAEAQN